MNIKEFYNTNADFKAYVDRYCNAKGFSVDVALTHAIVKSVAEYYVENACESLPN